MKNKSKYILIVSLYLITNLIALTYQSNFTIIIAPLLFIATIAYLNKDEIKIADLNKVFKDKQTYEDSYKAFIIAVACQGILNWLSIFILGKPHVSIAQSAIIPFAPVTTILFAPIIEEYLFRRIIFGTLQGHKQNFSVLSAIISSLLFAAGHMNTYGFLGYFAVGMVFSYFYFKTKKLHTTIITHMAFNFLVVLMQSIQIAWSGS